MLASSADGWRTPELPDSTFATNDGVAIVASAPGAEKLVFEAVWFAARETNLVRRLRQRVGVIEGGAVTNEPREGIKRLDLIWPTTLEPPNQSASSSSLKSPPAPERLDHPTSHEQARRRLHTSKHVAVQPPAQALASLAIGDVEPVEMPLHHRPDPNIVPWPTVTSPNTASSSSLVASGGARGSGAQPT